MIAGFIVTGTAPKQVIVRALGPTMIQYNVPGSLADPTLQLFKPDGSSISNDNWKDTQRAEIEALTLAPQFDSESAIVATLDPGAYTVILRGKDGGTGVGIVEVYDVATGVPSLLGNLSTRARVETADNALIGGIIVGGGPASTRVLARAMGPSLAAYGVAGALQDPMLSIYDSYGNVTTNDDWRASQEADIAATGFAPGDPRESAILTTLGPGNYTAVVRGKNDSMGVALVEFYRLP